MQVRILGLNIEENIFQLSDGLFWKAFTASLLISLQNSVERLPDSCQQFKVVPKMDMKHQAHIKSNKKLFRFHNEGGKNQNWCWKLGQHTPSVGTILAI